MTGAFRPRAAGIALGVALTLLAAASSGCRRDRVGPRRAPGRDAAPAPDPRALTPLVAPRLAPATAAELAYDAERRALLLAVVGKLQRALRELQALAKQGAAEPDFRRRWPKAREAFLAGVGRLRTAVLEVDPLGRQSWGARVASRLLGYLEVQLPNAVEESWDSRPGGALRTWTADFTLIWDHLRRYVRKLKDKPPKGMVP